LTQKDVRKEAGLPSGSTEDPVEGGGRKAEMRILVRAENGRKFEEKEN